MSVRHRRPTCRLLLAVLLVQILAGCAQAPGRDSEDSAGGAGRTAVVHAVTHLRAGLTEWSIQTSAHRVVPGKVTIAVTNAGGTVHDLFVRGRHGTWHTARLAPGKHAELTILAVPGETLKLWCSVMGHAAQGMRTTLRAARELGQAG